MQGLDSLFALAFPYIVVIAGFYLILILPQRKRQKQVQDMLNSLKEGDEVITIGGIIGKITFIQDDEVSIETGLERTKIKFARWAIKSVEKKAGE